jgi:hypothetical protein
VELVFTEKEKETLAVLTGFSANMSKQLGIDGGATGERFDILTTKTPSGKRGTALYSRRYLEEKQKDRSYVGALMEFFDVTDWCDGNGQAVLAIPKQYFEGEGEALVSVCDSKGKVVVEHTLTMTIRSE